MTFADLGLSDELVQAVSAKGYDTPTPIQAQAIPQVLMMRDLVAIAQTGPQEGNHSEHRHQPAKYRHPHQHR